MKNEAQKAEIGMSAGVPTESGDCMEQQSSCTSRTTAKQQASDAEVQTLCETLKSPLQHEERKALGRTDSPTRLLKELDSEKQEVIWSWRDERINGEPLTNAQIRERIHVEFGIELKEDSQMSKFWGWLAWQMQMEKLNCFAQRLEDFIASRYPGWSRDTVRERTIEFLMIHTAETLDPKKFAMVVRLDQNERTAKTRTELQERRLKLAEEKFKESLRTKLERGFDELALAFNSNSEAMKLYQQARELVLKEMK